MATAAAPQLPRTGGSSLPAPPPRPPPALPGTQEPFLAVGPLSKLSREDHTPDPKPCHGCKGAPDTEDARTPESSEFFLSEAFTDEQWVQLNAQILISGYLTHGTLPKEANMILAFGEPVEGQKHVWEEVWCAALNRCQNQISPMASLGTPPSSFLIGSCTVEQGSKDSTVGKSTHPVQSGVCLLMHLPSHMDVRTPESSELFLREPESSDKKIPLAREAFTDEQWVQLHAQILIRGYLTDGRLPKETNMILAFGQPVEGQKHVWEEFWRAALNRCPNQISPMASLATPPSSFLIGSCTVEQGSKDSTVGKSTVSKPHLPGTDIIHYWDMAGRQSDDSTTPGRKLRAMST